MSDILDRPISNYSDELFHYNVKGTNWYTHKFGNWERHAKYANGQPNPETKGSKGPYSSESARDEYLAKRDRKKGAYDAKRDAAINVLNNGRNYNSKQRFKASREMNRFSDAAKGALAAELGIGAGTYLATGSLNPIVLATFASPVSATIPVGTIAGAAGYNAYKQYKSGKGYRERYKNGAKDFEKGLSESTIKDLGLSKEYVKAYSKTMNEALKTYDKLGSTGKTKVSGKDIKYTGSKTDIDKQIARDRKQGAVDAKNDAAVQILDKGEKRTVDEVFKANNQLEFITSAAGRPARMALSIPLYAASLGIYDHGRSQAIKGYNKRYNDDTSYFNIGTRKRVIANNSKKFNKHLSKSKIKELGLSKEYVDSYSKQMNATLREYDLLRKTGNHKDTISPLVI